MDLKFNLDEMNDMNRIQVLFITVLALGSTSAMAEGGSERSQAFWKEFRVSQERIHGNANSIADSSKKTEVSAEKTRGKLAKD
ncbi:hypothetical protein NVV94_21280 [Pseudomonas sp. LS1212]|uniref:hypothetical protein n=1 Tax=Pseudomonas sp. LS1212 TaxID=2972478 RepID=UPI00215BF025|nr:hypothetical protein [Pseudomonas sp. LS1212]UVJ43082.1 hypothetical protein NVV94_21280 [Pseudomonas sp. LS1212]